MNKWTQAEDESSSMALAAEHDPENAPKITLTLESVSITTWTEHEFPLKKNVQDAEVPTIKLAPPL